jgi:two-component system cell cycle sensor histidine kinase/response regulator CckA
MLKTSEQRAIAIFRDVTRKKELEGKVLQSGKIEAIGRFAGGVAHDFNNLLSVMLNFTNLSINEFPGPAVPGYHDEIKKAILKASELPRQLLAFSKKQVLDP